MEVLLGLMKYVKNYWVYSIWRENLRNVVKKCTYAIIEVKKGGRRREMLLQFRIKNYKSFAEEAVLDMTATSIREHASSLIDVNGNKVLPVAAIYGANASGKSNLLRAFGVMCGEVEGALVREVERKNPLITSYYFDEEARKQPTEFEVSLCIDNVEYCYGFTRDQKIVYEEWLFQKKYKKGTRAKEKTIYYRDQKKLVTEVVDTKEKQEIEFVYSMVSAGELMLTALGRRKKSQYRKVYSWFSSNGMYQYYGNENEERVTNMMVPAMLGNNQELFNELKKVISLFDPDICGLEVRKVVDGGFNSSCRLYSQHMDSSGRVITTEFESESDGTKKLFSLMFTLITNIKFGVVLFIDELDAKLHPLILRYIIRLFTDPNKNTGKSQLVFSSHNLICLSSADLRRDEIWFVEKNKQKSELFSLYDFKEEDSSVRTDMNFGKNYLSGRFGAIPFQERED